jgi:peptide/nickel transport system permease protein
MGRTVGRLIALGVCAGRHLLRLGAVLVLGGVLGAALVRYAPGFGASEEDLDSRLSQQSIEALRQQRMGEESFPLYTVHWLGRMARGDLGQSQSLNAPVGQLLAERLPETLRSMAAGLALAWSLGLGLALLAAFDPGGAADLLSRAAISLLLCLPAAVLALLFVLGRAPVRLAVGLIVLPKVFGYARNLLVSGLSREHVLAARARGAGPVRILLRHVLVCVAPQLSALAGVTVSLAFSAAVPVEAVCDLPGIGQLAWKAAMERDLNLLVDLTMLVTLVTLAANAAGELAGRALRWSEA